MITQPILESRYADGTLCTDFNGPVTVFVKPGSGVKGSYAFGEYTVNAVNGVATFTGLGVNSIGEGYILKAICDYGFAESDPFSVAPLTLTMADAARCLQVAAGFSPADETDLLNRDLVRDGRITMADVMWITRVLGSRR